MVVGCFFACASCVQHTRWLHTKVIQYRVVVANDFVRWGRVACIWSENARG